jgi:hypothetical protein
MLLKSGEFVGQGRWRSPPSCSSNQTMTEQFQLCELGHCHLSLFANKVRIVGCAWLPNLSTYVLPCSNSAMKGNNLTCPISWIMIHGYEVNK